MLVQKALIKLITSYSSDKRGAQSMFDQVLANDNGNNNDANNSDSKQRNCQVSNVKLLLLGTLASGKSTLFKQIQCAFTTADNKQPRPWSISMLLSVVFSFHFAIFLFDVGFCNCYGHWFLYCLYKQTNCGHSNPAYSLISWP